MEKVVSTLTLQYRQHWSTWEAIREIFTNTMDETGDLPILQIKDDVCIIKDSGEGMTKRQFLLLGISEKKGENNIGKFGEGIKIGLVILLREGCSIVVRSQDWNCTVTTDIVEGEPVVAYLFDELDSPIKGVQYEITGLDTEQVKEMVDQRFLPKESDDYILDDPQDGKIMGGRFVGKLYHRGVWIQDSPKKSLFGYDLYNLRLGTDRQYADNWSLGREIGNLFDSLEDEEVIDQIISAWQRDYLESDARLMYLNRHWREVFNKRFGENAVIGADSDLRGKVSYEDGKLVVFHSQEILNALQRIGIKDAKEYIEERSKKRAQVQYKLFDEISERKKKNVKVAFGLVSRLEMFDTTFNKMIETDTLRFFNSNLNDGKAFATRGGGNIYIPLDCIHDPVLIAKKIIHELIHAEKGYDDLSEGMQVMQYKAIEKLARIAITYISPVTLTIEAEKE